MNTKEALMADGHQNLPGLLTPSFAYKPFRYPWAYDFWKKQQQVHWMPEEVPLGEDCKDWAVKLSDGERNLLTQIFRFFTQSDVEVGANYMTNYMPLFKPTEVSMMLASFSNMETIHIAAYALLLETIGMPDSEFSAFMEYKEMSAKHDYLGQFGVETELREKIRECCRTVVALEDKFIELAFEAGEIEGMTPDDIKQYIRYIADWRLGQLKLEPIYGLDKHPLPWLSEILNGVEHANFFEQRATEYSKGATRGDWHGDDGVWTNFDKRKPAEVPAE